MMQHSKNGQNILVNKHLSVFVSNFILKEKKKITKDSDHATSILAVVMIQLKGSWLKQQHKSLIRPYPDVFLWCLHLLALTKESTAWSWYNYLLCWLYVCFHGNEDYAGIFIKLTYIDRCEVKAESSENNPLLQGEIKVSESQRLAYDLVG